jgi:hypothetical protein
VPPARLATLHSLRAAGQAAEWIAALTTLDTIVLQLRYMAANWNVLTSTLGLLASLRACESGMLGVADVLTSQDRIWLLHVIVDYIKMHSGKQTSFGLAVITEEIKISTTNEVRLNTIDSIAPVKQWVSENTVMLALRMWHTGARRKRASIPDHHLARVCDVLARRLAPLRPPSPEADAPEIIATAIRSELEAKLLTYREFTPLQRLIESALAEADIPSAVEAAIPSCFAQHALARRPGCITALTGGTTCLRAGTVLVNWQSAHDSHTNDKRKELCARAVALRYAWDADHDAYVPRPGVTHLVLVIDGTWTQSDVDALARAGWDEVLYFDELDRLVDLVRRA